MRAVLEIVLMILNLYGYVIIATVVISWLIAFNVVNVRNDLVRSIVNTLTALTEPFLSRIRRFLPYTGGVDLSPFVLYVLLLLIERVIVLYVYPNVF